MAWAIEFDMAAQRELNKLDPVIARRILKFLLERVAKLDTRAASASGSRDNCIISGSIASAITAFSVHLSRTF